MDQFKKDFKHGINQILFFTVPFAMYLMIFSMPLVSIIRASKFTEDLAVNPAILDWSVTCLASVWRWYVPAKVCSAMRRKTLYAVSANARFCRAGFGAVGWALLFGMYLALSYLGHLLRGH